MEEKNKKTKVVNMTAKESEKSEKVTKYSYEELENIAHQLSEQSRKLYQQLQEERMTNMFKRLDYLFKVVESKDSFDEVFSNNCINEIKNIMELPKNSNKEDQDEQGK